LLRSLKLRLALASAVLIAASVAGTVLVAIHEVERSLTEGLIESNLGAAQLAATMSASVVARQRALVETAHQWPAGQPGGTAFVQGFLERQSALSAFFNRVQIVSQQDLVPAGKQADAVTAPLRGLGGLDPFEVAIMTPLPSEPSRPLMLAGVLHLKSDNFLSNMPRIAQLDDTHLKTFVANQQGYILAHADPKRLLSLIDDDPDLRPIAAHWRAMGSPLEPLPWTGRFGKQIAAMAAVPGTDWMLFRVADGDALFGAAGRAIDNTVLLSAGIAAAGALLIFGLTAWLLKPMGLLRQRALLALDPHQPPHLGWPDAGGEVGELARVLKHVSEQLAASRTDIEQALQQMQAVLEHAPVGIAFTSESRTELASSQLERLLGFERGELHRPWETLLADEAPRDTLRENGEAAFQAGRHFEAEVPLRRRDGSTLWARVHGAAVRGDMRRRIWIVSDATQSRQQREDLTWNATRDPLTELFNRREFERQLAALVGDRRRHESACALFIDLDHFKQVNDGAGHAAGDQILKVVAQALKAHVRTEDTIGRLGGDEFAVLLRGCPMSRGLQIAELIRAQIERDGICDGRPTLRITASIGVVQIDPGHHSLEELLHAADQACYAAKHAGRNMVQAATA
jgi:diguanylate cyclase (GGDEF)-like protein/PAS domain S-box-containing protein